MEHSEEMRWFDGQTSGGKLVRPEFDPTGMRLHFLYEGSGFQVVQDPVWVPWKNCRLVVLQERCFCYTNKESTQYLDYPLSHPDAALIAKGLASLPQSIFTRLLKLPVPALLAIFLFILIGGYLAVTNLVPAAGLKMISVQQEQAIGNKLYQAFIQDEKTDAAKTEWLQQFADQLQLSKQYSLKLHVVKDSIVNAFALPGGHIVVYTGILADLKDETELAALLSHEATHINQRHSLKSLLRSAAAGMLISVALSDVSGVAAILADNAESLRSLSYSRNLEREADAEGMKLLVKNHIPPIAMKKLMQRLEDAHGKSPELIAFISTHPATEERIRNAEKFAAAYSSQPYTPDPVLKALWEKLK